MKNLFKPIALAAALPMATPVLAQTFLNMPSFDGSIDAMVLSGSTLYLGGSFTMVNGSVTRNHLAAIDLTTRTLTSWDPGADGAVRSMALSHAGNSLYVGGFFSSIGGGGTGATSRGYLGELSTTTGSATAWNPSPNFNVKYISVSGNGSTAGNVYVLGGFTSLDSGNVSRPAGVAGIQADGTITSFNPANSGNNNMDSSSRGLTISGDGDTLYMSNQSSFSWDIVGGGNALRRGITAFQTSDGLITSFDPAATESGFAANSFGILADGDDLYVSGAWDEISGQDRTRLAKFTNEILDPSFDTSPGGNGGLGNDTGRTLALYDGVLYVLGGFDTVDGVTRRGLAAFDADTGELIGTWDPNGSATSDIGHDSNNTGPLVAGPLGVIFGDQDMQDLLGENVSGRYLAGLTPVPEPADYGIAVGALCLAGIVIRRSRQSKTTRALGAV